jgi:phosphoglycerate dehydrogenase-like enzyme
VALRAGGWQTVVPIGVHGATLGCLGLGRVGGRVATMAGALGMRVTAWSENLTAERAAEVGATLVTKDELLAASDVVSVHLRLSDRTRGLLGGAELAAMKPGAYLVNTSRGPIVDEAALLAALRSGALAAAALDVYDTEPLPVGHPFRSLDNVVLTPHLGYVTREGMARFFTEQVEAIAAWANGSPVRVLT